MYVINFYFLFLNFIFLRDLSTPPLHRDITSGGKQARLQRSGWGDESGKAKRGNAEQQRWCW